MNTPSLMHYLDESLTCAEAAEDPRDYLGISQLGRCARASGMALKPDVYPAAVQLESLRFWHEGHTAEDDIVARLQRAGCPVYSRQLKVTFPERHPLHERVWGHIDGEVPLVPAKAEGLGVAGAAPRLDLAILEIKSLRAGALKKLAAEGTVSQAWPQYGIQAHTYALCRGRHWVAFLVKDRNDGTIVECWEPFRADLAESGIAQGLRVLSDLDAGQLSGRDYNPGSDWQCRKEYCQFRDHCLRAGA